MAKVETKSPGVEMEFASIPEDQIPDSVTGLRRILAAERAVGRVYASLRDSASSPETRFLMDLLRRDWDRQFAGLLKAGDMVLKFLGHASAVEESLPPVEQVDRLVETLRGAPPSQATAAVTDFVGRAFLCPRFVPWVSDVKEAHEHFKTSVEAEERHLRFLEILRELLVG
jgi:hypothetical protein